MANKETFQDLMSEAILSIFITMMTFKAAFWPRNTGLMKEQKEAGYKIYFRDSQYSI